MKEFSCSSVVPGCDASFQAETEDELMAQVAQHAEQEHDMAEVPPEVGAQVRENIREV